ncbi:MAG TPA: glycosyltransferase [Solirubrobacteraceae bacterium]|nr:glycosyltransferase [Solirubrobacteraceae bacterium]
MREQVRDDAAPATRSGAPRLRVLSLARDAGLTMGGAEALAYEFAYRLDPSRFESYLCTTRRPEPYRRDRAALEKRALEEAGVNVLCLDRPATWSVRPWTRLLRLLAREQIDVIHAHMPRASVPGSILARLARVPVVISHEHGSMLDGKVMRPFLDRNVVGRLSTAVLAVSEWDRQQLIERERLRPDLIRVFPNAIPPPPEGDGAAPREVELPPGTALIGAIGRLYEEKGYDCLIRAVALLKTRGLSVRCVIAGIGPEEQRLLQMIAKLGVAEEIRMLGHREDVPDIVRALDVAVLPSRREGSPLALIEYMALGAPIVATAVGGVPELITDGVHGLLVPPRDSEALAAAIERLLEDRGLARRLGAQAQERQRTGHDLDAAVTRLERLYTDLVARSRGVGDPHGARSHGG